MAIAIELLVCKKVAKLFNSRRNCLEREIIILVFHCVVVFLSNKQLFYFFRLTFQDGCSIMIQVATGGACSGTNEDRHGYVKPPADREMVRFN